MKKKALYIFLPIMALTLLAIGIYNVYSAIENKSNIGSESRTKALYEYTTESEYFDNSAFVGVIKISKDAKENKKFAIDENNYGVIVEATVVESYKNLYDGTNLTIVLPPREFDGYGPETFKKSKEYFTMLFYNDYYAERGHYYGVTQAYELDENDIVHIGGPFSGKKVEKAKFEKEIENIMKIKGYKFKKYN